MTSSTNTKIHIIKKRTRNKVCLFFFKFMLVGNSKSWSRVRNRMAPGLSLENIFCLFSRICLFHKIRISRISAENISWPAEFVKKIQLGGGASFQQPWEFKFKSNCSSSTYNLIEMLTVRLFNAVTFLRFCRSVPDHTILPIPVQKAVGIR